MADTVDMRADMALAEPGQGNALPLVADPDDPDGNLIASDSPVGFTDGSDLTRWT